jgi:beta-aspartyl-peptidase (threonine type)
MKILATLILIHLNFSLAIEPILIVHGGAGSVEADRVPGKLRGTKLAARIGYKTLIETGSVLDAIEAAIRSMEVDENFNAGYGSALTRDGTVEMDACIMDGKSMMLGAVTGVQNMYHPITLARRVMEKTPYNFLGASGAMDLAKSEGFWFVKPGSLVSERSKDSLNKWKQEQANSTKKQEVLK